MLPLVGVPRQATLRVATFRGADLPPAPARRAPLHSRPLSSPCASDAGRLRPPGLSASASSCPRPLQVPLPGPRPRNFSEAVSWATVGLTWFDSHLSEITALFSASRPVVSSILTAFVFGWEGKFSPCFSDLVRGRSSCPRVTVQPWARAHARPSVPRGWAVTGWTEGGEPASWGRLRGRSPQGPPSTLTPRSPAGRTNSGPCLNGSWSLFFSFLYKTHKEQVGIRGSRLSSASV